MTWVEIKISDLYKVASSKRVLKSDWKSEGIPFYRGREITTLSKSGHVENELYITEEMYKDFSSNYGVPVANDIMVTAIGTIGNTFIVRESDKFYFKDASVLWLKKVKDVNSNFVNYWFKSSHFKNQLEVGLGATVDTLTIGKVQSLKISVPPISVQDKLVSKLDVIFSELDKAIKSAEANAKNSEALFQSYLTQVFERGGEGWNITVLDKVCKVDRGSSPRPIKEYFTESNDGVNWIKIGDTEEGGKYIFSTNQKITKAGAEKSRYVEVGDFILTNSMSYGRPYIMRINGYIHDGWFVLRLNKDIDSEYFYYLLTSPYVQNQFQSLAAGAVVKNISGDLVKKTVLPIPSLIEQKKLAEIFSEKQIALKRLSEVYSEKAYELSMLKQSILTKAFNGDLVKE